MFWLQYYDSNEHVQIQRRKSPFQDLKDERLNKNDVTCVVIFQTK